MSALGNTRLVAGREIRQRLRGKSFYLSTGIIVAAIVAGGAISRLAGDDGPAEVTVATAGTLPRGFTETLAPAGAGLGLEVTVVAHDSLAGARQALEDGEAQAVVAGDEATVLYPDREDPRLQAALQQAWAGTAVHAALVEAGLSPAEADAALSSGALKAGILDLDPDDENDGPGYVVGMLAGIALFFAVQMYGSFILMGVIEEKSTAVIEVLLARVRASHLLAGKVLGIGTVAVLQFSFVVAASVVSLLISGAEVPGAVWAALPWTVVWFVAGFAMYGFLFATAGALVSRHEDAQSAALPVSAVLVTAYMAIFVFVSDPGQTLARVLAPIPFAAPLLQPMRMAAGEAPPLEVGLALLLTGITIVALAKLSGHIYTQLALHRGGRVRWLQALRLRR